MPSVTRNEGIFSQEVGKAFRENILSRGDSDDPALLYRQFMGRDPDEDRPQMTQIGTDV